MKDTIIEYQANTIGSFTSNARITGHKEYEILVLSVAEVKDHLGNVRAVISDVKNPHNLVSSISSWTFTAEIRNLNSYYPYGMELPGGAYASIGNYGYGYNGMEKDDELKGSGKTYTTLFREGDVSLGTWWGRDPLEMSMPYQSPYILMDANPIRFTDVLGNSTEDESNIADDKERSEDNEIVQPSELSKVGIDLLIEMEGFVPYVYDDKDKSSPKKKWLDSDKKGQPTIGIGIVVDREKANKGEIEDITIEDAIKMKHDFLKENVYPSIKKYIKVDLNAQQYDAIVFYVYNAGVGNTLKRNFGKKINKGDFYGAALEMDIFTSDGEFMQGVFNRRMTERGVLLFGDYLRKFYDSNSPKHFENYYNKKIEEKKNTNKTTKTGG